MINVKWRGTYGVGDVMMALNACHQYAWDNQKKVHLEMHWNHDADHLHHPEDPETIWERMDWIHDKYHRQSDVEVEHVFDSPLFPDTFPEGNFNPDKQKTRWIFNDDSFSGDNVIPCNWIFKKEEFVPKENKIVFWTPIKNAEPPRKWKRFLTEDDWKRTFEIFNWRGWEQVHLTYRDSIEYAYEQIRRANFIICYDGMWHYIPRNFSKPMLIPSWERITLVNTPNAIKRPHREQWFEFIEDQDNWGENLKTMNIQAESYLSHISKYYEDR